MEIFEKVRKYLYENVGHLTSPGTPKFDIKNKIWKVPVLCKTEKGILVVGEFQLGENGDFISIPSKKQMERIVKLELDKLPFLFYGNKKDLKEKNIEVVAI